MDFVDGRIVLGEHPTVAEIVAASNVAARLGYETSALNLPVPRGEGAGVAIVIGRRRDPALKAGEGVVKIEEVAGRTAVVIGGGDEAGTMAAAELFAGRLPYAWDLRGPTLEKVASDVRELLGAAGVEIPAAYVRSGTPGVERLIASAHLESKAALFKAQAALSRRTGTKLSYRGVHLLRVELRADGAPPLRVDVPNAEAADRPGPLGRRPSGTAKENLDLSTLYSIDGGLGDSDNNLIPDRVELLLCPSGEGTEGTIDLAARLGLESTGISIPIAVPPQALEGAADRPESQPTLVLIGTSHPLIDRLVKEKKLARPELKPGEGRIEVVRGAFGEPGSEKRAIVITGGDAPGLARALAEAAERLPHVWARGKDRTTIDDVEDDVRKLLSARSPAGQAATALYKLDRLAAELAGKDLEAARVKVFVEKPPAAFTAMVRREAAAKVKAGRLEVEVENLDVQNAKPVLVDGAPVGGEYDIPSEVDDFWRLLRAQVVPAVRKSRGRPVRVEARLSEPPELRARLEKEVRAELLKAGAPDTATAVTILSAYKQGYSWLYDVVRPAVAGKPIEHVAIRFAEIGPPPEWK
ncbi:MAG TPA: hypothetical protein VGN09_08710, partial [Vicinamibacteria bacterium]